MLIDTLTSVNGKRAELRSGVDGSGKTIFVLQWLRKSNFAIKQNKETYFCYHTDKFNSEAEARCYFNA